MNSTRGALIVGAGIGGLAAAVALYRAGWQSRVFERTAEPRELGFALNLAPNAMAALDELGLAERVRAKGDSPAKPRSAGLTAARSGASTPPQRTVRETVHLRSSPCAPRSMALF